MSIRIIAYEGGSSRPHTGLNGAAKQAPLARNQGRIEAQRRLDCKPKEAGLRAKGGRSSGRNYSVMWIPNNINNR